MAKRSRAEDRRERTQATARASAAVAGGEHDHDEHRRPQQHGDERDAEAGGAGVEHEVASVGEGLGDDQGGQQRRRQQRDDAEQRPGQRAAADDQRAEALQRDRAGAHDRDQDPGLRHERRLAPPGAAGR